MSALLDKIWASPKTRKLLSVLSIAALSTLVFGSLVVTPIYVIFFDDGEEEYRMSMQFCAELNKAWIGSEEQEESFDHQSDCHIDLDDGEPSFLWITYSIFGIPETRDCIDLIHVSWEVAGAKIPVRATLDGGYGLEVKCSTQAVLATDDWDP